MYKRPTITVVGSVRGLTLEEHLEPCKIGPGTDNLLPQPQEDQAFKTTEGSPDWCPVS
jgi:hypothetical protein